MHFDVVLEFHIVLFIGSSYSYNWDVEWIDFGIMDPGDFDNHSISVYMIDFFVNWVWNRSCRWNLSDEIVGNYCWDCWSFSLDRIAV